MSERHQIVEWLLKEATAYRSKGRVSDRVHYKAEQMAIAAALDAAAQYILKMELKNETIASR